MCSTVEILFLEESGMASVVNQELQRKQVGASKVTTVA